MKVHSSVLSLVAVLSVWALAGCDTSPGICEPGKVDSCACPGDPEGGTQECAESGKRWLDCICPDGGTQDGSDGDGPDADGGGDDGGLDGGDEQVADADGDTDLPDGTDGTDSDPGDEDPIEQFCEVLSTGETVCYADDDYADFVENTEGYSGPGGVGAPTILPEVDHRFLWAGVRHQRNTFSCTAHALVAAAEGFRLEKLDIPEDLSEWFLYCYLQNKEKSLHAAMLALTQTDNVVVSESLLPMPFDEGAPCDIAFDMSKQLGVGAQNQDVRRLLREESRNATLIQSILSAGDTYNVAIVFDVLITGTTTNWNNPPGGFIEDDDAPLSTMAHAVLIVGYKWFDRPDGNKLYFIVRNSYGATWGDGGYAYVSADYLLHHAHQGFIILDVFVQPACSDECAPGAITCPDTTHFSVCGATGTDNCYHYGAPNPCDPTTTCTEGVGCACTPDCTNRECGPDGCGDFCPPNSCAHGLSCDAQTGQCVCTSQCDPQESPQCTSATAYRECLDSNGDGCFEWTNPTNCAADEYCDYPTGTCQCSNENGCTYLGQKRCSGTYGYEECEDPDGNGCLTWGSATACPSGDYCINGSCVPEPECEVGSGPCCDNGFFRSSSEVCDANFSVAYQCSGSQCGSDVQIQRTIRYCSGDNAACAGATEAQPWEISTPCASDNICNPGGGNPYCQTCACGCNSGSCVSPSCPPNDDRCYNGNVQTCDAQGCAYSITDYCDCGCSSDTCIDPTCSEGTYRCISDTRQICGTNGCAWVNVENCECGCSGTDCQDRVCAPGDGLCYGDEWAPCDPDGCDYTATMTCFYGCMDGCCLEDEYEVGDNWDDEWTDGVVYTDCDSSNPFPLSTILGHNGDTDYYRFSINPSVTCTFNPVIDLTSIPSDQDYVLCVAWEGEDVTSWCDPPAYMDAYGWCCSDSGWDGDDESVSLSPPISIGSGVIKIRVNGYQVNDFDCHDNYTLDGHF